ncbi:MAG: hypothetical protein WD267_04405 [Balneolales bacterium]
MNSFNKNLTQMMHRFNQKFFIALSYLMFVSVTFSLYAQINKMPSPMGQTADEPIRYVGEINTDIQFYDGGLPHAVGSHHYQTFRANRKDPSDPGFSGWTYNHQPYLAHWNGKFYLQFLSGLVQEHEPPTRILMISSTNGSQWDDPVVAFPEYDLPEIDYNGQIVPAGTNAVMHQRMGFYVAPNGKLLVSGFYGYSATPRRSPNAGNGVGRVIREVKEDGTFGPVYFIRFNRHAGWDESNTNYPLYTASDDQAFLDACEALLSDPLVIMQWWEEDRGDDGFYPIDPSEVAGSDYFSSEITTSAGSGKAFNYYRRPDDVIVGIWKNQYSSLSDDNGKTWTPIAQNTTLLTSGAKTWGERTSDGRYAIIHNQSATMRNRFPMAAIIGDDGHVFDRMYSLRGEVPPRRYKGLWKNPGVQYFRGIYSGNGNPPGDHMWVTYSVNKEDIWISRTRVPITGFVTEEVNDDFETTNSVEDMELWNIYAPYWAPVSVKMDTDANNKYIELRDEEPHDYASITRIFPKDSKKTIEFKFQGKRIPQGSAVEIEVQDQAGNRALKLAIDNRWLSFDIETVRVDPIDINPKEWNHVKLKIDCINNTYKVTFNGELYDVEIPLNDRNPTDNVERIVFRTGPYRNLVRSVYKEHGMAAQANFFSDDLPGSEQKSPMVIFNLDDFITK